MSPRHVLIVDDDDGVRALLESTLTGDDYDIVQVSDGRQALDHVARHSPDLVLLDWRMPGVSGAEVLAELKRATPDVPVIVLTAEIHSRPRHEAQSLGADVYLTKPFSPLELLDRVEELLEGRDAASGR